MADQFESFARGVEAPAYNAFAITASNSTDLSFVTRGIYTGTGGTLVCILAGDSASVTFGDIPAGIILPLRVKRVLAAGTTATGLVGLY